jgi:hypothetical protein
MSFTKSAPLKLSVVIPVYNEQDTIGKVIDRVRSVDLLLLRRLSSQTMGQQMLLHRSFKNTAKIL